jgi:nucleoporin NUP159
MRDRVQKLEDHLEASKKRLAQMKTGMPGLRFVI